MAQDSSVCLRAEKRHPADEDICPLLPKSPRTDGQTGVCRPNRKLSTGISSADGQADDRGGATVAESSEDELGRLDLDLSRKSKQLNLTSRNVRAILHEVITHEHVVEMMKAAIRATQDLPMFEPKMTRSRLRQAVQHGQTASWSVSTVSAPKTPQFVDIDLEEEEDSSDEEYCPEEQEEDDTAEETLPSDGDSLSSPPRMHWGSQAQCLEGRQEEALQKPVGSVRNQADTFSSPQHLLPPPDTSSFLERLNAVEEELDCGPAYHFEQCLDRKSEDDDGDGGPGGLASRTRSKLPLVDVPLVQLEAELLAPDTTADMYEQSAAVEDRHWTAWLQGLVALDNEEEAEDEDDPEYNFLDDLDEPDLEDYRTDRAVQITKKEVNELLDELFDTLQEEETEAPSPAGTKFNIPKTLRFEAPLANMLTERRRTVRKQYEAQQQRRALLDTTNQHREGGAVAGDAPATHPPAGYAVLVLPSPSPFHLDRGQRLQLQQQVQQHVQLLTQLHLLCRRVETLNHEACMTENYLEELEQFAKHQEQLLPGRCSSFRTCNLRPALDLLREVPVRAQPQASPRAAAAAAKRWLPSMTQTTSSHAFPLLPTEVAWLFATRPVFLYPELLPVCSLERRRDQRSIYTAGENGLLLLALRHFEGSVQPEELISSYLLCKSRWSIRKHIKEMSSSSRSAADNVIKMYLKHKVMPTLPVACGRVQPEDQRPPVDRSCSNMPNWLKNSQLIIQKVRLANGGYPPSLPPGCSLRLHPHFLHKCRPPSAPPAPRPPHRRFFTLAHNASLLPLAKSPAHQGGREGRAIGSQPLPQPPPSPTTPADAGSAYPVSPGSTPFPETTGHPRVPCTTPAVTPALTPALTPPLFPAVTPAYVLLQMAWTPPGLPQAPPTDSSSQQALGQHGQVVAVQLHSEEAETSASPSTLSPLSSCMGEEEEKEEQELEVEVSGVLTVNGGENGGGGEEQRMEGEGGGTGGGRGEEEGEQQEEQQQQQQEEGSGQREEEPGEGDGGGGGGEEEDGEKDKDEEQERQGDEEEEEEEEEDFDELTQDEDEEEVMSSASEESVLSVPELQETMKQLTWLAAERRHCTDGDSEEEHSAGSQEEEEEEEEEGPKGEESGEGRSGKESRDEEAAPREQTTRGGGGRCPGRGRGRSRPLRGPGRSRQERHSKDSAKLLLLYDDNILDNDPQRESKNTAFAQSYLSRVREALQDTPERVQDFVSLLHEFEQVGEGPEVTSLFRKLRGILGEQTELLRDFAAFLHPEQALQCGLLEEQQAFERSRRFLRQLEITFGENPSHYQKIIKALQTGPDLSPASIQELKSQMETLLKGHTHLQSEFWVFFEELRPPPARPGQFEEAHWPEEAGGGGADGGDGVSLFSGGGASGFEEVTLPELEEEEEGHKILPMSSRRQRRKLGAHRSYKDCDWSDKDWPCLCGDAKNRRLRRKGCSHCHGSKTPGGVSRAVKSLHPVYSQLGSAHDEAADAKRESPPPGGRRGSPGGRPDQSSALWEAPFPLADEKEEQDEEEEEEEDAEEERRKKCRIEEVLPSSSNLCPSSMLPPSCTSSSVSSSLGAPPPPPPPPPLRPSPPLDVPVCAKNISLTASGEKVILWTREADRVILTTCQQEGANQSTFQAIATLLGNKTPNEVSRRFRDLMRLFRTAARQTGPEDDAPPTEPSAANEEAAEGN